MDIDEDQEPEYPLDSKSYIISEEIGRGTSTIVYRAFCEPMNTYVAIKSINLDKSLTDFDSIMCTPTLNHPNILNSHCTFIAADNKIWVVMPLMSAGSLQSLMSRSFPTGLPESHIYIFLKQTLNLLSYLHSMEILNMELKAGNILVDLNGTFKFSDFGLWCSSRRKMKNINGNPYWIAPELIESNDGYSMKSDIWSFGILALELAHGKAPLSDIPMSKSMNKKINQRFSCSNYKENDHDITFSKKFKSLVKKCLKLNPEKRPTLKMLRKHRFFKRYKSTNYQVDKMFELSTKITYGEEEDDEEEEEKWDVVHGWNLNVDIMKLFPFYSDKIIETEMDKRQVQFGDITVFGTSCGNTYLAT
ncbi:serine/threonine-protein kinase BLUS1-like [Impatiens glandulifera]|uniref:serine/threonine-protein kinase BLUS1-like n=1 Tax=Impatiens glandulifera TaxID=253017 RepID=UPI001FB0C8DD|nr:serine/threonine-protein kinase BLUS1-like [Impatiens glandulifera]